MESNKPAEEKIKEAARLVFTKKGYAATRTRDIAEASGVNLALLNYYFKSKEKLFDIIMLENIQVFSKSILEILNNPKTSLFEKIEILVSYYIDMLVKNPEVPIFVLSELRADPKKLFSKIGNRAKFKDSIMIQQWQEMAKANKTPPFNPVHIIINAASMIIFPFVANPMIRNRSGMSQEQFNEMMEERKKLVPKWIISMIKNK
jgi:AcrR family transcriptional regulator